MNITYLSDTETDFAYLEKYLDSGSFGQLNDEYRVKMENELLAYIKYIENFCKNSPMSKEESNELISTLYKDKLTLPTRYESITQYNILKELIKKIKKSIKDSNMEFKYFPYWTTIPTGEVNACAIKLPEVKKEFLLFDSQLFLFCHLFSKAFSICLPITKKEEDVFLSVEIKEVNKHLNKNKNNCIDKIIDILENYTINNHPGRAKQYFAPKEYENYIRIILNSMELLIVGHEFGHFNCGHLDENAMLAMTNAEKKGLISKNHFEEYQADLIGCILTYQSIINEGYDSALSFIGIDLFFSSMILSLRYESFRSGVEDKYFKEEESDSHPTFAKRRQSLRLLIREIDGFKENIESIEHLYTAYDDIIESIWKNIEINLNR